MNGPPKPLGGHGSEPVLELAPAAAAASPTVVTNGTGHGVNGTGKPADGPTLPAPPVPQ